MRRQPAPLGHRRELLVELDPHRRCRRRGAAAMVNDRLPNLDDPMFAPVEPELAMLAAPSFVHPTTGRQPDAPETSPCPWRRLPRRRHQRIGRIGVFRHVRALPGIRLFHPGNEPAYRTAYNYATEVPWRHRQHITRRPSEYPGELTFDTVSTHVALCVAPCNLGPQFVFEPTIRTFRVISVCSSGLLRSGGPVAGRPGVKHLNARTLLAPQTGQRGTVPRPATLGPAVRPPGPTAGWL